MMGIEKIKVLEGQSFKVAIINPGESRDLYGVERLTGGGEWPSDSNLITMCDPFNLGGYVGVRHGNRVLVTVYTD